MYKKISKGLIFCILLSICVVPTRAQGVIELTSPSAILIDANSGAVLFEKNADDKRPPASVTKIMTMLLTMEAIDNGKIKLEDKVTISKNASDKKVEGTKLLLEFSEVRTVNELLLGVAIESANDAAIALGEHIAGSLEGFVALMNTRAKELNMEATHFVNPHGLNEEGHVTSARDIATMSRELLKHKTIFEYISKYMTTVYVGRNNDVKRELVNKNKMVRFYEDVDGIKTGFTNEAMFCMSLTASRDGLRLISVVMGASANNIRNIEARKIIDYGFANYENKTLYAINSNVGEMKIKHGNVNKIPILLKEDIKMLMKKGDSTNDFTQKIVVAENLKTPIKSGDCIGEIIVYSKDIEVARQSLYASQDIKRATILTGLKKILENIWVQK